MKIIMTMLAAACVAAGGCAGRAREACVAPQERLSANQAVFAGAFDDVFDAAAIAVSRQGYGISAVDRRAGTIETAWNARFVTTAPGSGQLRDRYLVTVSTRPGAGAMVTLRYEEQHYQSFGGGWQPSAVPADQALYLYRQVFGAVQSVLEEGTAGELPRQS